MPLRTRPPLDGLATIVYGGAPMYAADLDAARAALGPHLAQIYGQGESPMTITVLPQSRDRGPRPPALARSASPRSGSRSRWSRSRSAPKTAASAAAGEPGEVCVKRRGRDGRLLAAARGQAAALRDGWLWTGDIGRLDEDGFLTLLDRSKDLVICGGNNVYPREVEEVLLQHPAVAEAAVIGRPDAQWGEALVAYVVLPRQAVDAAGAGRALPGADRALQAAQGLSLRRGAAQEQLRQGAEDRTAGAGGSRCRGQPLTADSRSEPLERNAAVRTASSATWPRSRGIAPRRSGSFCSRSTCTWWPSPTINHLKSMMSTN